MAETIRAIEPEAPEPEAGDGSPVFPENLDLVRGLDVRLEVVLGEATLSVGEVFDLTRDAVIPLDRDLQAPVEVMLNGKLIARGRIVAVGEQFGVQITEIGR